MTCLLYVGAAATKSKAFHCGKSVLLMNDKGEGELAGPGTWVFSAPVKPNQGTEFWRFHLEKWGECKALCRSSTNIISHKWTVDGNQTGGYWRSCAPARQGPGAKVFMDKMYVLLVEQSARPTTQREVMQGWSSFKWYSRHHWLPTHSSPSSLVTEHRFGSWTWCLCIFRGRWRVLFHLSLSCLLSIIG